MSKEKKLTKEEFVIQGIEKLRIGSYKGIHVVFTGFNEAFKRYFGEPSRVTVDKMVTEGLVEGHPEKGGFMLYKKGEMPLVTNRAEVKGAAALSKIIE